jgi:putative heme-binding domain-containing protein
MSLRLLLFVTAVVVFPSLAWAEDADPVQSARDEAMVAALLRLENFDLESSAKAKAAVGRYLKAHPGSEESFTLIRRFGLKDAASDLVQLAIADPESTTGYNAARLAIELGAVDRFAKIATGENPQTAAAAIEVLGLEGSAAAQGVLLPLATDSKRSLAIRSTAVAALGQNRTGERKLLALVEAGELPADLQFTAANVLFASGDESIRTAAAEHLTLPEGAGSTPLPPIKELAKQRGDAGRGKIVFDNKGTCIKCHKVRGQGKEVGPDLSEIGSKLSKEAFYVAILDPSAGISHNYETYALALADGNMVTGLMISQTPDSVTIRTEKGIDHTIETEEIDVLKKQTVSLMPAGLQKLLTLEELVDVVEYLTTLKKPM